MNSGPTHVALIRGINVGRAKRVAMADLRAMITDLGYENVTTLLNSGNALFTTNDDPDKATELIERGLEAQLGVPARVVVLSAAELDTIISENPLLDVANNPSRLFAAVLANRADAKRLKPLLDQDWNPEVLAVGSRAAYIWCPDGIAESPLSEALGKTLRDAVTTRNWATMTKLHALF